MSTAMNAGSAVKKSMHVLAMTAARPTTRAVRPAWFDASCSLIATQKPRLFQGTVVIALQRDVCLKPA
jgi:hypothetical protein